MKTFYRLSTVVFLICLFTATSSSQYQWYGSDANWTNGNNWYNTNTQTYGAAPTSSATVQILHYTSINPNVNANASCAQIAIVDGATLNFNTSGKTLTVSGEVDVNDGGTISFGSDGILEIGTKLRLFNTGNLTASLGTVKFNGSEATIKGSNPTFNNLILGNAGTAYYETSIIVNGTLTLNTPLQVFPADTNLTVTIGSAGSVSRTTAT